MNFKSILLIYCLTVICGSLLFGQQQKFNTPNQLWTDPDTQDFKEIQGRVENFYKNRDKGRGSGYKQWKRWEYLMERRLTADGKITNFQALNLKAIQEYQLKKKIQLGEQSNMNGASWSFLGPTNWIKGNSGSPGLGRINVITFHPSNSEIIYVGAPAGGVWKTTNSGNNWIPLTDDLPVIGVSGIVVDYVNPNILYLLTGDGDGGNTYTIGVLKSTDGGLNWNNTGLNYSVDYSARGYKLAQHPTNNQILFSVQSDGLWKTSDGGVSWHNVLVGSFRDLEFKPGNPDIIYASSTDEFYRSTDEGEKWTLINSGLTTGENRIAIGVSPADSNYVYLLCGSSTGEGSFKGVFRSTNSGLDFNTAATTPNILGVRSDGSDDLSQSAYDLALIISQTDASKLMSGGINTWRSTDNGTTWEITSYWVYNNNNIGYTHADIHALEINPLNNILYCCSDGGVFSSTDFGDTWIDISAGLGITQFYRIAGVESNPDLILGGTQDNGSNIYNGTTTMTQIYGGDGTDCMIDYNNNDILYVSYQFGGLNKSTDGGFTFSYIKPIDANGSWVTPFVMNPTNSNIIYGGYTDVYKSTNGGSNWINLGVSGTGALAIGTDNNNRLYASDGWMIWTTGTGSNPWTDISNGLPLSNSWITFIAVNPSNSSEVYVTIGLFRDGNKVFRSTNSGGTWENISGTLPNIIVNCIAYEDNSGGAEDVLYIGTDVGVYSRYSNGGDWTLYNQNLPYVPVFDLEVDNTHNIITAGTYGRGLWRSPTIPDTPPKNYSISILPPTQTFLGTVNTLIPLEIKVGDPNAVLSPDNLYSVSFRLNWDLPQYIEYSNHNPGSWLDPNPLHSIQTFYDHIEVELSRTDGFGQTGSGIVLLCTLKVKAAPSLPTTVTLTLSHLTATRDDGSSFNLLPTGPATVTTTSIEVWPGDALNWGDVNETDVVRLVRFYNITGTSRPNGSCSWGTYPPGEPQICPVDWTLPLGPVYADCNGDGIVNAADILCIGLNYGKTHILGNLTSLTPILSKANTTGSISMISVSGNDFATCCEGSEFEIDIMVGDPSNVTDFIGASFNLSWSDTSLIEAVSTTTGSFLGGNPLIIFKTYADHIEVGNTSTSGGKDGSGVIATCTFKVKNPIWNPTNIDLTLTNITAIDAAGDPIDLTPTINPLTISIVTDVNDNQIFLPNNYELSQNYPNPFNPSTTIKYQIPKLSFVILKIFDVLGRNVTTLINEVKPIGSYEVKFDSRALPSGIYFYRLLAGNFIETKKMVVMK